MSLFQYPKEKHKRRLSPRQFRNYQRYKRYLQNEFSRVCVYCRQPDTSSPNLAFGADHYRPKSLSRFAHLAADYANLYYCCATCNSRKRAYWPQDEARDPYVVNPCDFAMAQHLWFEASTGVVRPKGNDGRHTEDLLQLNADALVRYRLNALLIVRMCDREIAALSANLAVFKKRLRSGDMDQTTYDIEFEETTSEIAKVQQLRDDTTGETQLPALPVLRWGIVLHT